MDKETEDLGESTLPCPPGMVPAAPLIAWVEKRGGVAAAVEQYRGDSKESRALVKRLTQAYFRAKSSGLLTIWAADELSFKLLGEHPLLVFGTAWDTAIGSDSHDPKFGKVGVSAYSRGCRCGDCRIARNESDSARAQRRKAALSTA